MQYTIKKPTCENYQEIANVWEASVRETHDFLKEEDIQYFKPLILDEFLQAVDLSCIFNNDRIIAFLGVANHTIEMLFIHPDFRGKGIGRQLTEYALNTLKVSSVDVNEQNVQAVGFYHHMGFITVGRSELDSMGKPFPILHMKYNRKAT